MNRFNKITNDEIIINTYNKIEQFEDLHKGIAYHDIQHAMNVVDIMDTLLTKLGYDENFIEEAKIAGILHDVGVVEGKKDHAVKSYKFAKDYLDLKGISLENKNLVLDAIKVNLTPSVILNNKEWELFNEVHKM